MGIHELFNLVVTLLLFFVLLMSLQNLRRHNRIVKELQRLWRDEAPPVPAVEIVLKTGDVVTVQPTDVLHKSWVWGVPIDMDPELVEEIKISNLPPWTSIVPMPGKFNG